MEPISYFHSVWQRCDEISAIHSYLSSQVTGALNIDELLRAEWVGRVSALDMYLHELIAQKMSNTFTGACVPSKGFNKFQISNELLYFTKQSTSEMEMHSFFDLEIRRKLGFLSFQDPEKIADGIRLISDIELWNEIALLDGASQSAKSNQAKSLKRQLSLIVERRNKIAHEGDLQPGSAGAEWPINQQDLLYVTSFIRKIVESVDTLVN